MGANRCARGVSWKGQVQRFMADRLCQCVKLRDEVLAGTWRPREVEAFTLSERGKIRRVMPVAMRDRVVEWVLCYFVLVPLILKLVIEDCSACLEGRGIDYAVERVRGYLEEAPPGAWVFQFDFHDYFHSIRRADLIARLRRYLIEPFVLLVTLSIGGDFGTGLELGSYVCQVLAVWYPTPLDHLIQSLPGLVGYHRYMDDGVAIFETRAQALNAMSLFAQSAAAMGLAMNPRKTHCNRATTPFVFCKRRFTKRSDGVRVNIRKEQTHRLVRHDRRVVERAGDHEIDLLPIHDSSAGYFDSGDATLSPRLLGEVDWPSEI